MCLIRLFALIHILMRKTQNMEFRDNDIVDPKNLDLPNL